MKKSVLPSLFMIMLLLNLISFQLNAQENTYTDKFGELNPETGLPKSFEKYQEYGQKLSDEESRKEYLKQEWTKILAKNKFFGPILFYGDKIFSGLNPLWKLIFGIEFSFSWFFMFSFSILIILIILIYSTVQIIFTKNKIPALVISVVISLLIGISGVIKSATEVLSMMIKNTWIAIISLIIAFLIVLLYEQLMKDYGKKLKEEKEKEQLERDKEIIHTHAEISKEELEERTTKDEF